MNIRLAQVLVDDFVSQVIDIEMSNLGTIKHEIGHMYDMGLD